MTRGLMCISSKMPGWMKKFTYSGSRAHLFQFGMTKKKNFLFSDNVGFHQSQQFYETYRNQINTTVYMLPENHTDKIQPIDAGCERIMKVKLVQQWKHGWKRRIISINGRIDFQQRIEEDGLRPRFAFLSPFGLNVGTLICLLRIFILTLT